MDFWQKQRSGARRAAEQALRQGIRRATAPACEGPGYDPTELDLAGRASRQEG